MCIGKGPCGIRIVFPVGENRFTWGAFVLLFACPESFGAGTFHIQFVQFVYPVEWVIIE